MRYRPYANYVESGVGEVGTLPADWAVGPIKRFLVSLDARRIPLSSEERGARTGPYPYYGASGIIDSVDSYLFDDDHILVSEDGANLVSRTTPIAFVATGKYWVNNHAHILHPRQGSVSYWAARIESASIADRVTGAAQPKLTIEALMNMPISAPCSQEAQCLIVDFLGRETAKIDELIGKQNALIGLLAERRKAVITRAVTKGLDPKVPMKDSGVKWLGLIPATWETRKLKYVARAIIGLTYDPSDIVEPDAGGTLVLRSGNVQDGLVSLQDCVYVATRISPELRIRSGDILVCSRNGSRALIGKSAVLGPDLVDATFGAFMTVVRSALSDYLNWVLKSSLFQYQLGSFSTSTINQLTVGTLNNFELPVPPAEHQQRIAAYLQGATAKLDHLVEKAEATVRVLQERRSALITAAVTGKIDVREPS